MLKCVWDENYMIGSTYSAKRIPHYPLRISREKIFTQLTCVIDSELLSFDVKWKKISFFFPLLHGWTDSFVANNSRRWKKIPILFTMWIYSLCWIYASYFSIVNHPENWVISFLEVIQSIYFSAEWMEAHPTFLLPKISC